MDVIVPLSHNRIAIGSIRDLYTVILYEGVYLRFPKGEPLPDGAEEVREVRHGPKGLDAEGGYWTQPVFDEDGALALSMCILPRLQDYRQDPAFYQRVRAERRHRRRG